MQQNIIINVNCFLSRLEPEQLKELYSVINDTFHGSFEEIDAETIIGKCSVLKLYNGEAPKSLPDNMFFTRSVSKANKFAKLHWSPPPPPLKLSKHSLKLYSL